MLKSIWGAKEQAVKAIEIVKREGWYLECLYGPHEANLMHRGTAYCRSCYDEKARLGLLIDQ